MSARWVPRGITLGVAALTTVGVLSAPAVAVHNEVEAGQPITLTLNMDVGGFFDLTFVQAFGGTTPDGTDVHIYTPQGAFAPASSTPVPGVDPRWDPDPTDDFVPCADADPADYRITQQQVDQLGAALVGTATDPGIVAVDESHFGPMGTATSVEDPDTTRTEAGHSSDDLVVLVYNVVDEAYFDCAAETRTAGYFAPEFAEDYGLNALVVDLEDWAVDLGPQPADGPGDAFFVEGVIAHELEHLLHSYSDEGELSWVDEGLADWAFFANGYPVGGSHITYQQVFHRETSLTRWGGGLENYGAAYLFFQYLWERAGGNGADDGAGQFTPDQQYDGEAGDLLLQLVFENDLDGMAGVQAAITQWNATTSGADLPSVEQVFQDWTIALYLDQEGSTLFDIRAVDFGDPTTTTRWTIEMANATFWKHRGQYNGATPESRWLHSGRVPDQVALPFGVSYETFRNPGSTFTVSFEGEPQTVIPPHTGATHWYGGYESMSDNVLDVDAGTTQLGGAVLDFWTWYFIEDGWDFGFVEALVDGRWVTVPLVDDTGQTVTTDEDPHGTNSEGNGLTGTSGGTYFVDEPEYVHLTATLPAGTTDVQLRYSTDAAYLDTGWFVDDVQIAGQPVTVASDTGEWFLTTGAQDNNWAVTLLAPCDINGPSTEGQVASGEEGWWIYRFNADALAARTFSGTCLGSKGQVVAILSNMPTGDLQYLDAPYTFRLTKTPGRR